MSNLIKNGTLLCNYVIDFVLRHNNLQTRFTTRRGGDNCVIDIRRINCT